MSPTLALAVCLGQIQDSPRARVELDNNIRLYAERIETPDRLSVQLTALLGGLDENAAAELTQAHLIEHLAASGKGDLDSRLELQGMYLTAETSRDAITFRIDARPEQLAPALDAIKEILEPLKVSEEALAKEKNILREERAVAPWSTQQGSLAFKQLLNLPGHDGFFDEKTLESATPETISAFQNKLFAGQRMSIVVIGGLVPKPSIERMTSLFGSRERGPFSVVKSPSSIDGPRTWGRSGLDGGVRSVAVEQIQDLDTLAVIGAGMALGMRMSGSELLMSPSARAGVVTLANASVADMNGLNETVKYEASYLSVIGLKAVQRWVDEISRDPAQFAALQGPLTARDINLTVSRVKERSFMLTPQAVQQALSFYLEQGGAN